jgi:hypothetical protein
MKAPILVKLVLRRISSGRRNWPSPPVGPRTRTKVNAISNFERENLGEKGQNLWWLEMGLRSLRTERRVTHDRIQADGSLIYLKATFTWHIHDQLLV